MTQVHLPAPGPDRAAVRRRRRRLRLPPCLASEPDRLRAAAVADAQGRLLRDPPHARTGEVQAGAIPAGLDLGGVRRPRSPPPARGLLGQRQPDRPPRRLRRGEALRRGADDGLPPAAGRQHCIARIFNTFGSKMRPHDGRAIPTFLRQALQDKPVTVFGDGSQTRSFCYVDDLIRGLSCLPSRTCTCPSTWATPTS